MKKTPDFISKQVILGSYFFANLTPAKQEPFSLVCAGKEECCKDYVVRRSGFKYFAFEVIEIGYWDLLLEGTRYKLGPGSIFLYGPNTSYLLRPLRGTKFVKYFVDFTGLEAKERLEATGCDFALPGCLADVRWIRDLLDQLLDCVRLPAEIRSSLATKLTDLILSRIPIDLAELSARQARETYDACERYMRENYLVLKEVSQICAHFGLSAAYLSRLFQRFAHEKPASRLRRLKIDHAAELLLRHKCPSIARLAQAAGFENQYHFSRVFKQVYGLSPRYYIAAVEAGEKIKPSLLTSDSSL